MKVRDALMSLVIQVNKSPPPTFRQEKNDFFFFSVYILELWLVTRKQHPNLLPKREKALGHELNYGFHAMAEMDFSFRSFQWYERKLDALLNFKTSECELFSAKMSSRFLFAEKREIIRKFA